MSAINNGYVQTYVYDFDKNNDISRVREDIYKMRGIPPNFAVYNDNFHTYDFEFMDYKVDFNK